MSGHNQKTNARIAQALAGDHEFKVIHQILISASKQPFDAFIANSSPIRYMDQCRIPNLRQLHCNRGASGIDGNIATVIGLCLEPSDTPLIAIVGDLAALYDLNAFLMMDRVKRPLTIVIINNGGGCIFERLPIATQYEQFDEHFKLSHSQKISSILQGMGLNTQVVLNKADISIEFNGDITEIFC